MTADVKFTYSVQKEGEWARVLLAGPITEYAKDTLQKLSEESVTQCILDLGKVSFANSAGIRDWAYMLKDFRSGRTVVFENVPDELVRTMNMVLGFRQGLPVRSVQRIFCCDSCNHDFLVSLSLGTDYFEQVIPAPMNRPCPRCQKIVPALDAEDDFFMFLTEGAA